METNAKGHRVTCPEYSYWVTLHRCTYDPDYENEECDATDCPKEKDGKHWRKGKVKMSRAERKALITLYMENK